MPTNMFVVVAVIVAYLLGMVWLGVKLSKQNETTGDFYLGGRKLGPLVTAMSAEASDMSSWLLMGIPGLAYVSGICDPAWTCIGLALGTYLNWLIVARRLRRYSHRISAITLPEFYAKRYHDHKHVISLIAAIVIIVFFIPYTASGFSACGKLFNSLFGVKYQTAMVIFAAVIVFYTTFGGFTAASTSDLIQSIIMSLGLIIILVTGVAMAGGVSAVLDNAKTIPGLLSLSQTFDPATGTAKPYGLLTVFSMMAWGLGYFGMPHVLLRFMAIEDANKLATSRRIATVWVVISMGVAILIGIVGLGASANGAIPTLEAAASETVIVEFSSKLASFGILPAAVAGLVLAGILAATMSTADSQLLAAASSASEDIIGHFFGIELSDKKKLIIARVTVLVISLIAIFFARDPNSSVFRVVSFAWAGFGAAFGPVTILALFWKKSNKWGALAGMAAGGAMVFIWKFLIGPLGGVFGIYELLPAFLVALLANVLVSLATGGASAEVQKEFDDASVLTD